MNFSTSDKEKILALLELIQAADINGLSTEVELWMLIDQSGSETRAVIKAILALDPREYGFRGQRVSTGALPNDTVAITSHEDTASGEYEFKKITYLSTELYSAFTNMNEAFTRVYPERKLIVGSGYRSPAFQIVTLLYILAKVYDFDLTLTLKRVAMPNYSQHCSASNTAIDMLNIDGQPNDEEPQKFADSLEYTWLCEHAAEYGFRESYPPDNPDGIMWEPWHWQFVG